MIFIVPTNTCFWIWCFINDIKNYKNIYKIKKRNLNKPLAIFVEDFNYLKKYTNLSNEQITFLKNYDKPFTILVDKKYCKDKQLLENIEKLPNNKVYKKIAFRIAHLDIHKKLINKNWLFFLTSANKTWENEIKSIKKIQETFNKEIIDYKIKFLIYNITDITTPHSHSDIFEFTENWIRYIRK